MLFMVIERFKNQDAKAIYRRLRDEGRSLPDGPRYGAVGRNTPDDRTATVSV